MIKHSARDLVETWDEINAIKNTFKERSKTASDVHPQDKAHASACLRLVRGLQRELRLKSVEGDVIQIQARLDGVMDCSYQILAAQFEDLIGRLMFELAQNNFVFIPAEK